MVCVGARRADFVHCPPVSANEIGVRVRVRSGRPGAGTGPASSSAQPVRIAGVAGRACKRSFSSLVLPFLLAELCARLHC